MIKNILRLTRPKQWIKNFFVFIPMFFGGELFDLHSIELVTLTFFAYSFVASSIYCYNDIVDVDADRNHPVKCQRPIASGALSIRMGYTLMIVMFVLGIGVALTLPPEVMSNVMAVIVFYYVLNLAYCSKLKQYAILDVCIVAFGFVLRILAGGFACELPLSNWIVIMTFLLTLFMSFAKRRDDVLRMNETGEAPRKNTVRYNLTFINQAITITASVTHHTTINWDFWLHDELTFWYVPAIMALYLVAPWYMRLIERYPTYRWLPMLMVVWCVMVQWVLPIHAAVGHLEIFWSRVPIFFIGINMGEMVRSRKQLPPDAVWLLLVTFLMTFGTCLYLEQVRHGHFPLFVERMLYIPFTVCSVLVMNRIFRRTPEWVNRAFRLVGMLSLEAYLIHIHFVLVYIQPMGLGYWGTFAATVAITLPVAWVLHQTTSFALNIFSKK